MNTQTLPRLAAAITLAAGLGVAAAIPAQASVAVEGRQVGKAGNCSAMSTLKLNAKADDGQIEVEAEVHSRVSGQTWSWRITDNGNVAAEGSSTTRGEDGSLSVNRRIADQAGKDKIVFKATNQSTGETCQGTDRA